MSENIDLTKAIECCLAIQSISELHRALRISDDNNNGVEFQKFIDSIDRENLLIAVEKLSVSALDRLYKAEKSWRAQG